MLGKSRFSRRPVLCAAALSAVTLVGGPGPVGLSPASAATSKVALSRGVPEAPASVTLAQVGVAPDLRVSWKPSTAGVAATGALVQLHAANSSGKAIAKGQIICGNACTSAVFRSLSFGTRYTAEVWASDAAGKGTPKVSPPASPTTSCTVGACVTFDSAQPIGPANHAASGVLKSVYPGGRDQADMTTLKTTMFRGNPPYVGGTLNWSSWKVAVASGAQTTMMLSSLWKGYNSGPPPTPWSDWSRYTKWVTTTVTSIVASKEKVDYWDVYNEPGGADYYSAAGYATVTPALLLQQFLVTYRAIRKADPSAAIIGPSLQHWSDYPSEYTRPGIANHEFDMVTFLNFAAKNDLKLAAISWHEIDDGPGPHPSENTLLPANIEDHVAEARTLLAARPSLGKPLIFVNEYALPELQSIPGWDVAYLAALTDARVNSAVRSCWFGDCGGPTLDGLLGPGGRTTLPSYWDRTIYASMSGDMIATTSTNDNVTAVGSYNASTHTVTGLIGRGVSCNQVPTCTKGFPGSTLAAPTTVKVTITVPWKTGSVDVSLTRVPGSRIVAIGRPTARQSHQSVTAAGTVTISMQKFADGDAYGFTITRIS